MNVQGEVYLDVQKDSIHPFVVRTNHLEVRVLGTAFNVTDYAKDSETSVVLVRGSVDAKWIIRIKSAWYPTKGFLQEMEKYL